MTESGRNNSRRALPLHWQTMTQQVIGAAMHVHSALGPGLLEGLYEDAMCIELELGGLRFERQRAIRMHYRDRPIGDLRIDLVVEGLVIVEIKAIERVLEVHKAQLLSYLRSADPPLGLLINFGHPTLREGLTRRINERCSLMQDLPFAPPSSSDLSENSEFLLNEGRGNA